MNARSEQTWIWPTGDRIRLSFIKTRRIGAGLPADQGLIQNNIVMLTFALGSLVKRTAPAATGRVYSTCVQGNSTLRADLQAALADLRIPAAAASAGDASSSVATAPAAAYDLLHADPPYCLLTRRRAGGDLRDPKGRKNEGTGRFENVAEFRKFTHSWMAAAAPLARSPADATWIVWTNVLGREPTLQAAADLGWTHLAGEYLWCKRPSAIRLVPRNTAPRESAGSAGSVEQPIGAPEADERLRRFAAGANAAHAHAQLVSHVAGCGGEAALSVVEFALVLRRRPLPPLRADEPARAWSCVSGHDDDGEHAQWGAHPNHKPFTVLEPLLRGFSSPGAVVLEPFAGSGSTLAAAARLRRHAVGVEIDPRWVEVARRRAESTVPQP